MPAHLESLVLAIVLVAPIPVLAAAPTPDDAPVVHRAYHDVDVGGGVTLSVVEAWTDASLAREPRRALLTIAPTLVTHKVWDADVPGDPSFSALHLAAERGFVAYAFDHGGYGESSAPANGMDVTAERMLEQTGALLDWVRARTGDDRVDLLSGSLGNSIAVALGGVESPIDPAHVGALVLTANVCFKASLALSLTA